jgi:hypothetical protein
MKVTYVFGILFAGALSMGCVAQAGTDESSQAEGLTADQGAQGAMVVQQKQAPTAAVKQRVLNTPQAGQSAQQANELPPVELEDFSGADPGGNVTDDGDGKEPDPHPWHATTTARASH